MASPWFETTPIVPSALRAVDNLAADQVEDVEQLDQLDQLDQPARAQVEDVEQLDQLDQLDQPAENVEVFFRFQTASEVILLTSTIDTDCVDRHNLCQVGFQLGVMMSRRSHKGEKLGEYSIRYFPRCLMCGHQFASKRPDAKTGSNLCRSALRRWCAKYGHEPEQPPGITPAGKQLVGCPVAVKP